MPTSINNSGKKRTAFLRCDAHGRGEGYLVCLCVIQGERAKHVLTPADSNFGIGEILCSQSKIHAKGKLLLICEECAHEHGWLRRPATMTRPLREAVPA